MNIKALPHQMRAYRSEKPTVVMIGARGSGKTTAGATWSLLRLLGSPRSVGLIGGPIPAVVNAIMLPSLFSLLAEAGVPWVMGSRPPWPTAKEMASWTNVLSVPNGSMALCRSFHQAGSDNNLRGLEVGWLWLDEARQIAPGVYDVAKACLRGQPEGTRYQTFVGSTPNGHDWLWSKFASARDERVELIRAKTADNRHLPAEYESELRALYSKDMARQELEGEFVDMSAPCATYRFDYDKHVRPVEHDRSLPLILSCDQGVAPYVGIVLQVDQRSRRAWVLDEVVISDNGTTEACAMEFARRWRDQATTVWHFCDPTSIRRDTRGGSSDMVILQQCLERELPGCRVREEGDRRVRGIADSVNCVNALLDPATGEPRLAVHPKCTMLIDGLTRTRWLPGQRKLDKTDREKDPTHAPDAMKIALAQLLPVEIPSSGSWGDI